MAHLWCLSLPSSFHVPAPSQRIRPFFLEPDESPPPSMSPFPMTYCSVLHSYTSSPTTMTLLLTCVSFLELPAPASRLRSDWPLFEAVGLASRPPSVPSLMLSVWSHRFLSPFGAPPPHTSRHRLLVSSPPPPILPLSCLSRSDADSGAARHPATVS
jgi:hypothetical protein